MDYQLGALVRPHNPKSDKWALSRRPIAKVTKIESDCIIDPQFLVPIGDQGQMGSCAAVSTERAASMARKISGGPQLDLHWGWIYYHGRLQGNLINPNDPNENKDTGSYIDTNLDILKIGAPSMQTIPYVADARWIPPQQLEDEQKYDYVLNYAPVYANEGLEQFWTAFQANYPVVIGMFWPDQFFGPFDGPGSCVLPSITVPPQGVQAHATYVRGGIRYNDAGTWKWGLIGVNQWSETWTINADAAGKTLRKGEYIIPEEVAKTMIYQALAVSYEPFTPDDTPQPTEQDIKEATKRYLVDIGRSVIEGYVNEAANVKGWRKTYAKYAKSGAEAVVNLQDSASV